MTCPTATVVGVAAMPVASEAGAPTVSTAGRVAEAVRSASVFASRPRTETAGARLPLVAGAHAKTKATLWPPARVAGVPGVDTPQPASGGVRLSEAMLAEAPPPFETARRSVYAWPMV